MEWINTYLSCRYEDGARGPEMYDCWGLVREARHLHLGKRLLPSWGHVRHDNLKEFTRAYREEAALMEPCAPENGAIAVVIRGRECVHLGLIVEVGDRLKVLEINPSRGARCLPLSQWARDHNNVIYYRDRE
ncbi:hypothetical protein ACQKF2_07240 [Pseudomonas hunanensis]|uniref:hypothetical protein n=1 Tax=Pseudomonas hunanensis TaxID=1247546 RepID=UPI003D007418